MELLSQISAANLPPLKSTLEMFDMPQLTELQWFGAYIVVGACALVLMRLYVKWVVRPPQQSEFVTVMMAAIRADQPYDWRKTAKSVLFVPLAVLVWPLSIGVGISEIRKPAKTYPEPPPEEKFRCQREHLRMPISIAEAQNLGVVSLPHGWDHYLPGSQPREPALRPGSNISALLDDRLRDPLSGNAVSSSITVEICAADALASAHLNSTGHRGQVFYFSA